MNRIARSLSFTALTALAAPAFAESPPPPKPVAAPSVPPSAKMPEAVQKEVKVREEDVAFATQAAQGSMTEIEASKSALSRGKKKEVRAFATMMIKDHGGATDELKTLADSKNIALPASVSNEKRLDIERMTKAKDFDIAYMTLMVAEHEAAVALFEKTGADSKDEDVRAFAEGLLPKLQNHQRQAREIKAKLEAGATR